MHALARDSKQFLNTTTCHGIICNLMLWKQRNLPKPSLLGLALDSWNYFIIQENNSKFLELNTSKHGSTRLHYLNLDSYDAIFPIYLLQLFDNILCAIRASIINNDDFKINIPNPNAYNLASGI